MLHIRRFALPGQGQERGDACHLSRPQPLAQERGGGEAIPLCGAVMSRSPAGDGDRFHVWRQKAEVLHPQVVVGEVQQGGGVGTLQSFHRLAAALGEGFFRSQFSAQSLGEVRAVEAPGQCPQGWNFAALAAEGEDIHHPRGCQERYRPPGKPLGGGGGPHSGQLQHQVHTAGQGHLCTGPLIGNCTLPPLDPVAAHDGHHGGLLPELPPGLLNVPGVSGMERVIFRDNSDDFQERPSCGKISRRKTKKWLSILKKSVRIGVSTGLPLL